jgi:hypothetical protein
MLQAQFPIDTYFISVFEHPEKFGTDNVLFEKVENIVDILKSRLISKGLDYTCTSLRDEIWVLRFEVLEQQKSLDELFDVIHNTVVSDIIENIYNEDKLTKTVSDSLELYSKIILGVKEHIGSSSLPTPRDIDSQKLAYMNLRAIQTYTPTKDVEVILNAIENSLDFECCLIINALFSSNKLSLDVSFKELLSQKLKNSVINFAFYYSLLGVWMPDDDDETQYIRNIKILLADYELKNGNAQIYPIDIFRNQFIS